MEERVLGVLRKYLPEVTIASHIDNLKGWDSLNHLRCLLGLEDEFKISFTPEEMAEMTSVVEMISIISAKISAN